MQTLQPGRCKSIIVFIDIRTRQSDQFAFLSLVGRMDLFCVQIVQQQHWLTLSITVLAQKKM